MGEVHLYGYRLRPQQVDILGYTGGQVAVTAVPGSGKTLTLALLAARLIIQGHVGEAGDVLVVTVQNSAVNNISAQIRRILTSQKLPPVGYRVCTLHKLAADILRQRLDLAGVEEGFSIIDDNESQRMMQNAAGTWIADRQTWWRSFLPDAGEDRRPDTEKRWREETEKIGRQVSKLCKHLQLFPDEARTLLGGSDPAEAFLRLGIDLYEKYAQYLKVRGGLDFDDLIWRACDALEQDAAFLQNLRAHWPFILEDESQDSSPLQERILARLAGEQGNWVRVGDPNQAINSTFTSADPRYFRRFVRREGVHSMSLSESGRSARPIIALANHLVLWGCEHHPEEAVREMAFRPQQILPTSEDDPQPNPADAESRIHFRERPFPDVGAEAGEVARWAAHYVNRYPRHTVAVLCPAGWQGGKVVEELERMVEPVPYDDLLRTTPRARQTAKVLAAACDYLGDPTNAGRLSRLYRVLVDEALLEVPASAARLRHQRTLMRSLGPHDLLFPPTAAPLSAHLPPGVEVTEQDARLLEAFADLVGRWVRASSLPVDQLILTIAQDLFYERADEVALAICHTIALSLRATAQMHPALQLADFAAELGEVARNRRSLSGLSLAEAGYQPEEGRVVVTTMHKAKGLEWDAVYLMCVDSLEFPDTCADAFRDEVYFMPGRAPALEACRRLEQLAGAEFATPPGRSLIDQARLEYIAERLRLLYVGITRAKRNLAFTWSELNGRRAVRPSTAMVELRAAYDSHLAEQSP